MSRSTRFLGGLAVMLAAATAASAANLTPGNLVVVRVGDGTAALSNASTAVFLDEYTPGGTLVQSLPLPTAVSGANNPLTNSGSASSEGYLNLSANGQYLVQAGYGIAPGTVGIAATTSAAAPRVVARIALDGTIDTSTLLNGDTSYSGNNIRSATSNDGTQFWTSGTALLGTDGGVRYVASLGANTSTQLTASVTNTRVIGIAAGQLYVSTSSGAFKGVNAVGTGLPNTTGQTTTLLPGMGAGAPSQYDFFFADPNTLYVADDTATGGIQKWTQSAGTWTLAYTLAGTPAGARGLTGVVNAGVATLYATSTQTSANTIVTVTDTGAGSVVSVVATAGMNTVLRGLRLVPNNVNPGSAYCLGDGTGTACPCANNSTPGNNEGCLNSLGTAGKVVATGNPSIGSDSLLLTGSGMPNSSVLYFQGTGQTGGGLGVLFGDGLRCVGGTIVRLKTKTNAGGGSIYPDTGLGELSISVKGAVAAPGVRNYQAWYRNAAAFCTASTFNLTNGWNVTWTL